jgi:hypothetical protein
MTDFPPNSTENKAIVPRGRVPAGGIVPVPFREAPPLGGAGDIVPVPFREATPLGGKKGGAPLGNRNALGHGAPPKNKNAVKHGLYSHWFSRQEHTRLDKETMGELDDEEFGLKITLDRLIHSMQDERLTHDQIAVAARAVGLLSGRIESIHRSRKVIYDNQTTIDKALEELKSIPPEED